MDPTTGIVTVGPDAIAGEYEIEYTICSTINTESCSTTTVTVIVPGNAEILTADSVAVFNGISPNGDGLNDFLVIQGLEDTESNTLRIYNRWGVLVYETSQYGESGNFFRGVSNGRVTIQEEDNLPSGTYFYVLEFTISGDSDSKAGYIYIN